MITFAPEVADPATYLPAAPRSAKASQSTGTPSSMSAALPQSLQEPVDEVIEYLYQRGFSFEPWQVAAFITAVRSKPFVVLAGISGTGKTKLPRLVAEATGGE